MVRVGRDLTDPLLPRQTSSYKWGWMRKQDRQALGMARRVLIPPLLLHRGPWFPPFSCFGFLPWTHHSKWCSAPKCPSASHQPLTPQHQPLSGCRWCSSHWLITMRVTPGPGAVLGSTGRSWGSHSFRSIIFGGIISVSLLLLRLLCPFCLWRWVFLGWSLS